MKQNALLFTLIFFAFAWTAHAQTQPRVLYTFVYNHASAGTRMPVMIGAVNTSDAPQSGIQMGLYNSTRGYILGAQFGFINAVFDPRTARYSDPHVGGAQFGFYNATGSLDGAQFGFVNQSKSVEGAQFGFVNVAERGFRGAQFGFTNVAGSINGFQCGFINIAERVEAGVPLGFLSFVREGGYQAAEYSISNLYPFNLSVMTGLEKFYSIITAAYNPGYGDKFTLGCGVGSIFPLGKQFSFLPEATMSFTLARQSGLVLSLTPNFGYDLGEHFTLIAAPVVSWQHAPSGTALDRQFIRIADVKLDAGNRIDFGVRLAVRYKLNL